MEMHGNETLTSHICIRYGQRRGDSGTGKHRTKTGVESERNDWESAPSLNFQKVTGKCNIIIVFGEFAAPLGEKSDPSSPILTDRQ